jgi:hypothetical protein
MILYFVADMAAACMRTCGEAHAWQHLAAPAVHVQQQHLACALTFLCLLPLPASGLLFLNACSLKKAEEDRMRDAHESAAREKEKKEKKEKSKDKDKKKDKK